MGTNYYARIIPTHERKKELKEAIEDDDFSQIGELYQDMYGTLTLDITEGTLKGGKIHLGKQSYGWRFLWNPNLYKYSTGHMEKVQNQNSVSYKYVVDKEDNVAKVYELDKYDIRDFILRDDVVIYDEYGEEQDKNSFITMSFKEMGKTGETDNTERPVYHTSYVDFLKSLGYNLSSHNEDFICDGLRFATVTEFA